MKTTVHLTKSMWEHTNKIPQTFSAQTVNHLKPITAANKFFNNITQIIKNPVLVSKTGFFMIYSHRFINAIEAIRFIISFSMLSSAIKILDVSFFSA